MNRSLLRCRPAPPPVRKSAWYGKILLLAILFFSWTSHAVPLVDSRVGGISLVGPSIEHPASQFYNPAVLGLYSRHYFHSFTDATLRLSHGSIQRPTIDKLTGEPKAEGTTEERLFAPFPQGMLVFLSNLMSESVVLSLSVHNPVTQSYSFLRNGRDHFDPTQQGPLRYHATNFFVFHMFTTLAASLKLASWLHIGVSWSFVVSWFDYGFVRDTALDGGKSLDNGEQMALDNCGDGNACNYESDDAAEAIRIKGDSKGIAFSVGLLVSPHSTLNIGAGYISRIYGPFESDAVVTGEAYVRRSNAVMRAASTSLDRNLTGKGNVDYRIPQMVALGATWHPINKLTLDLQFRWILFSSHEQLNLRFSGSSFRKEPRTISRINIYRGFQDAFSVQVGVAYQIISSFQLQVASMLETSAVPREAITPISIDSLKADSMLALKIDLGRFSIRTGYGLVAMPSVDVDRSIFSPSTKVSCVDSFYDVDLPACKATRLGQGIPSAAGSYFLMIHRFSLSLSYHYSM